MCVCVCNRVSNTISFHWLGSRKSSGRQGISGFYRKWHQGACKTNRGRQAHREASKEVGIYMYPCSFISACLVSDLDLSSAFLITDLFMHFWCFALERYSGMLGAHVFNNTRQPTKFSSADLNKKYNGKES